MTNPTSFWRDMQAMVNEEIDRRLNAIPGLTPGVYNGLTVDRLGRVTFAQAVSGGGGNLPVARYMDGIGRSIPTGTETIVDYADPYVDTDSLVTTGSSWNFACPTDGEYLVIACWLWNAYTWNAGTTCVMHLYRNGSAHNNLDRREYAETSSSRRMLHGSDIVTCNASDTIDIRIRQDSGGSRSGNGLTGMNYVSIAQLTSR